MEVESGHDVLFFYISYSFVVIIITGLTALTILLVVLFAIAMVTVVITWKKRKRKQMKRQYLNQPHNMARWGCRIYFSFAKFKDTRTSHVNGDQLAQLCS